MINKSKFVSLLLVLITLEQILAETCYAGYCLNGGTCQEFTAFPVRNSCRCPTGYQGTRCEIVNAAGFCSGDGQFRFGSQFPSILSYSSSALAPLQIGGTTNNINHFTYNLWLRVSESLTTNVTLFLKGSSPIYRVAAVFVPTGGTPDLFLDCGQTNASAFIPTSQYPAIGVWTMFSMTLNYPSVGGDVSVRFYRNGVLQYIHAFNSAGTSGAIDWFGGPAGEYAQYAVFSPLNDTAISLLYQGGGQWTLPPRVYIAFGDNYFAATSAAARAGAIPVARNLGYLNESTGNFKQLIVGNVSPPGPTISLWTTTCTCASNPCQNGATCTDFMGVNSLGSNGYYNCTCVPGYTGRLCQTDINECASNPCMNGGQCVDGLNSFTCYCFSQYSGNRCQSLLNACASNPCQNGGTCNSFQGQYSCTCVNGFTGTRCETAPCSSSPCQNGATCSYNNACTRVPAIPMFIATMASIRTTLIAAGGTQLRLFNLLTASWGAAQSLSTPVNVEYTCSVGNEQNGYVMIPADPDLSAQTTPVFFYMFSPPGVFVGQRAQGVTYQPACLNMGGKFYLVSKPIAEVTGAFIQEYDDSNLARGTVTTFSTPGFDGTIAAVARAGKIYMYTTTLLIFDATTRVITTTSVAFAEQYPGNGGGWLLGTRFMMPSISGGRLLSYDTVSGVAAVETTVSIPNFVPFPTGFSYAAGSTNVVIAGRNPATQNVTTFSVATGTATKLASLSVATRWPACAYNANLRLFFVAGGDTVSTEMKVYDESAMMANVSTLCEPGFNCTCVPGYVGTQCQTDLNECASNPCMNGGQCVEGLNGFTCYCYGQYTGTRCQSILDACASNPCQNGGSCTSIQGQFLCTCVNGFTGTRCETNTCASSPCQNGATCGGNTVCTVSERMPVVQAQPFALGIFNYILTYGGTVLRSYDLTTAEWRTIGSQPTITNDGACMVGSEQSSIVMVVGSGGGANATVGFYSFVTGLFTLGQSTWGQTSTPTCMLTSSRFYVLSKPALVATGAFIQEYDPVTTLRGIVTYLPNDGFTGTIAAAARLTKIYYYTNKLNIFDVTTRTVTASITFAEGYIGENAWIIGTRFMIPSVNSRLMTYDIASGLATVDSTTVTNFSPATFSTGTRYTCSAAGRTVAIFAGAPLRSPAVTAYSAQTNAITSLMPMAQSVNFVGCAYNANLRLFVLLGGFNGAAGVNNIKLIDELTLQNTTTLCNTGYNCTCVAGYSGSLCQTNNNECASQPCRNGGTCVDGTNSFSCTCPAGYSGIQCQTNVDECSSQPCRNGGTCTDGINSYSCACTAGYSGLQCQTNINECASQPCANGGTCTDGIGSYTCACATGFSGVQCLTNYDECASQPCLNGGTCVDGANSFQCQCTGAYSGEVCQTQLLSCASWPCMNGGECVDGIGSYTCVCAAGFSGIYCQTNIDECASQPCERGGTCQDQAGYFVCLCPAGYSGSQCQTEIDECGSSPCENGGTCTDGLESYQCACVAGFSGLRCETNINECASGPCENGGTCVDANNGYTCTCVAGYSGLQCQTNINECGSSPCENGGTCVDADDGYTCTCVAGYSGLQCQTNINECASAPCENGGTCTDGVGSYQCTCVAGFSGLQCQTNINECVSNPCENGGTCTDADNGYTCACVAGYSGLRCQTDINECGSSPCENGGTCVDEVNRYVCTCVAGFSGLQCQTNIDECASSPCENGGTCVGADNGYSCTCVTGFSGSRCQTDINECGSAPCENGGTCVDSTDGYSCTCVVGYSGLHCQTNIDECSSNPCENGGTCVDSVGGYNCTCLAGFSGLRCQTNINECASMPCKNGGTCTDTTDGYTCACVAGYSGLRCQTNVDECASNPCVNGGTCIDGINSFRCNCRPIYTGNLCQTEFDECASSPCQNGGTCVEDTPSSYACECEAGFTGIHCETQIDECASHPCENGGTCTDELDSYSCECPDGFSGTKCETNNDECATLPCENGGTCEDGIASYRCVCPPGYSGQQCQTDIDECSSSPCEHGGTCVDEVAEYRCECTSGFSGSQCQTNINECESAPCLNGATCVDQPNGYNCTCAVGFAGAHCQSEMNHCASQPCLHGGTCITQTVGYTCNCTGTGYNGTHCETKINECAINNGGCELGRICYGSHNCSSFCVAGYSTSKSNTCVSCAPGSYNAYNNRTVCLACPVGRFQSNFSSTICQNCTAGHYASQTGSTTCPSCPPRTYQLFAGRSTCNLCTYLTMKFPGCVTSSAHSPQSPSLSLIIIVLCSLIFFLF